MKSIAEAYFDRLHEAENEKQRSALKNLTDQVGGKTIVVKFKVGGRIKEPHTYDSETAAH